MPAAIQRTTDCVEHEREREKKKMSASYIRIDCSYPAAVAVNGGGENKFSIFCSLFARFAHLTLCTFNAVEREGWRKKARTRKRW